MSREFYDHIAEKDPERAKMVEAQLKELYADVMPDRRRHLLQEIKREPR